MTQMIGRFLILLALPISLVLTGCATSGNTSVLVHDSVSYGVYGGYGYPGYGYNPVVVVPVDPDRPDRPNRPERPAKPDRPSVKPAQRPSGSMGRPSRGRRR